MKLNFNQIILGTFFKIDKRENATPITRYFAILHAHYRD